MSSSYVFVGSGFYIASASGSVPGTVRVKYSSPPKAVSNLGVDDALNVSNYVLSGPGPYGLLSVSAVLGDPLSFDLILSGALIQGSWTVTVSNVKTPANVSLGAPTAATFLVTVSATPTDLTAGAEQDTAESIIRKHLNQALKGDNWNALIYGLSRGDDIVWEIAQNAYDQLFLSTASGSYLEQRSSDIGISKPTGVGINESVFRKFAIKSNANKVVQQSIREILEAFYGTDSLRAFAEAEIDETYNLSAPLTLEWLLDETEEFSYTFVPTQFAASSKAKALEVAVQLTKYMRDLGSNGFAVAIQSSESGKYRVRIYSGSLGLRSSVKVTGGTAQNTFRFPTYVEVYSGNVTSGSGYTWVVDHPTQETARFSLTTTGIGFVNLSYVQIGDYVIIGDDAQAGTPGVYEILNVEITWSGANITQRFTIERVDPIGSLLQLSNDGYRFFRPKKNTTNAGSRTIVVSQSVDGRLDVSIPATTQAVSRAPKQAFYARLNAPTDILQLQRRPNGTVTVRTSAAHGLTANSQVLLEGVEANQYRPFVYSSPMTAYPTAAKAPISYIDNLSVPQSLSGSEGSLAPSVSEIGNGTGEYVFTGGYNTVAGAYGSSSTVAHKISNTAGTAINSAMEADGQVQNSYNWLILGDLNVARQAHGQSSLGASSVLVTGGYQRTNSTFLSSCETLSGTAWLPANSMVQARAGHAQMRLADSSILVIGGAKTPGTATGTVESFDGTNWTSKASMILPRVNFKAVPLTSSKILVIGGRPLGRSATYDSTSMLAQWKLDEASGTAVADDGGVYNLTAINGATVRTDGKIDNCRDFNFSQAHATGAGNGAAVTALTGEWTICLWFKRTTFNTTGELFTYGATNGLGASGADTNTSANHNVLVNIGITAGNLLRWKWEQAAGSYVSGTAPVPYTTFADQENFAHLALRKKLNASGTTYDVEMFVNGIMCGQWLNQNNATGGSLAAWYIARNPELGNISGNGFQGLIDNVTVFKYPLNQAAIVRQWELGSGTYQSEFDNSMTPEYGHCTPRCEIYDIGTNTWSETGAMNLGRAFHEAHVLSDGRVLVMGGLGKDPSSNSSLYGGTLVSSMTEVGIHPNRALRECEIYDPVSGRWQLVEPMGVGRKGLAVVSSPSTNELIAFGGSALSRPVGNTVYSTPSTMRPEILNLTTMKWRTAPTRSTRLGEFDATLGAQGYGDGSEKTVAVRLSTGMVMVSEDQRGLGNVTGFQQPYELYVPSGHAVSSGGLNGQFKVVSVPDSTQFTIQPLEASEFVYPMNARGANIGDYQVYGNAIRVTSLTRASNVVTATANSTAALAVGDVIQLNVSEAANFPSGLKTVVTVPTATTFTYNETGADSTSAVEAGVSVLTSTPASIQVAAKAGQANDPGPFVFDPDLGVSITGTEGSLAISALAAGRKYGECEITVTKGSFPDTGYIVFGFGGSKQSKPVKYFSTYPTTGSNVKLILDYGYLFEFDNPVGTSVTLLASRVGFQPQSLVGSAYITGSSAGRTAAQSSTEAAIAAGIDPNITIVYPGDRGLGGESYPASNATKLSDAVFVWAGDDIDEEIEAAKEGN